MRHLNWDDKHLGFTTILYYQRPKALESEVAISTEINYEDNNKSSVRNSCWNRRRASISIYYKT